MTCYYMNERNELPNKETNNDELKIFIPVPLLRELAFHFVLKVPVNQHTLFLIKDFPS